MDSIVWLYKFLTILNILTLFKNDTIEMNLESCKKKEKILTMSFYARPLTVNNINLFYNFNEFYFTYGC